MIDSCVETGWIQGYQGQQITPLNLQDSMIDIVDIAVSLSREARFHGRTRGSIAYNVAHHSVLVSLHCLNFPLEGLMHDAEEAYLKDMPRPVKRWLENHNISVLKDLGDVISQKIFSRWGLKWPLPQEVKAADLLLMTTEARDLMSPLHPDWHHTEANGYPCLKDKIVPMDESKACRAFLLRWDLLTGDDSYTRYCNL